MKTSLSEHYKKIAEELLECLKDARLEIEEWGAYSGAALGGNEAQKRGRGLR